MRRIHFDRRGPVWFHYPYWQPWGCLGCLGRALGFLALLFLLLLLLSQFRSCDRDRDAASDDTVVVEEPVDVPNDNAVPPINDDDVIDDGRGGRVVSNRVNVLFQAEVGAQEIERWKTRFFELYSPDNHRIVFCDINTKLMSIEVPAEERRTMIERLPEQISDIPFLVFEENVMEGGYRPSDPGMSVADASWHLDAVKAARAWDLTKGSDKVIVAVVDSYFDLGNPELEGLQVVNPYSVEQGSADVGLPESYNPGTPDPVLCHGTMVATLAVGGMDNGHGVAGIAPQCSFMPISLGARFGTLAMLQGLLFAINKGAQVVNISAGMMVGDEVHSWPVDQQIEVARRELLAQEDVWKYVFDMCEKYYVTIVWAAGNEDVFTALDASKRGDNTIKVSSVNRQFKKSEFSNFGNFERRGIYESTVSAPGEKVYGEVPRGESTLIDGTSFSAPIVSGCVGLMKSLDGSLTTREIIDIFKATGRKVEGSTTIGPVVQIGPALEKVVDGFLPFETLKAYCNGGVGVDSVDVPTTLLRPLRITAPADSTMLPPLVHLRFRLGADGKGRALYVSNYAPDSPWSAPVTYTLDASGAKVIISQPDEAVRAGASNFNSANFTVEPDSLGKAQITVVESESVPAEYKPFLKKHS